MMKNYFNEHAQVLLTTFGAVFLALMIGLLLVYLTADDFSDALVAFFDGMFGSTYAVGASLNRAVTLALVGMGFVFASRANLVNVGGEGQIAMGGIFAAAMALYGGVSDLPLGLAWILPLIIGTLAGSFWCGIAGVLKVQRGTNEVISTLLLIFIGLLVVYWSVQSDSLLRKPRTNSSTLPESAEIPESTMLPYLMDDSSLTLHVGLLFAVIFAVIIWILLNKGELGFRLRAIGLNDIASRRAGISAKRDMMLAMFVSGGFSGLAGAIMILGEQWYVTAGFSSGYGFDGLVAGLLARGSVPGVLMAALFFGFLRSGGLTMEMMSGVPSAVVYIIQGLVVVFIAGASRFADKRD